MLFYKRKSRLFSENGWSMWISSLPWSLTATPPFASTLIRIGLLVLRRERSRPYQCQRFGVGSHFARSQPLGLMREDQSPVRDGTATLKESGTDPCSISQLIVPADTWAVIKFYIRTEGWTELQVPEQILDVYDACDISNYSTPDSSALWCFIPCNPATSLPHRVQTTSVIMWK